jgi:hypothetical protein
MAMQMTITIKVSEDRSVKSHGFGVFCGVVELISKRGDSKAGKRPRSPLLFQYNEDQDIVTLPPSHSCFLVFYYKTCRSFCSTILHTVRTIFKTSGSAETV